MPAVAILEREHALIVQALDVLAVIAGGLEQGRAVPVGHPQILLDFLRDFADRHHHVKEEAALFPLLERRGIAKVGGPIGVMLHEHEQGRTMIRIMEGLLPELAGSDEHRQRFAQVAKSYAELMRNHIAKENRVLFPMAQTVLTPADQDELEAAFTREDNAAGSDSGYTHHQAVIADLSARVGLDLKPPAA